MTWQSSLHLIESDLVFLVRSVNPLMANDAFKRHKRFHLLEKGQFSQEKVQMCENHQIRRADFGEKIHAFLARRVPPHGRVRRGAAPCPHRSTLYGFCMCV